MSYFFSLPCQLKDRQKQNERRVIHMPELTIEVKEKVLSKLGLRVDDVVLLTGYSKKKCYRIMKMCREEFNGRAGAMSDMITPFSLCLALGTTLEDEMRYIGIAKGYQ